MYLRGSSRCGWDSSQVPIDHEQPGRRIGDHLQTIPHRLHLPPSETAALETLLPDRWLQAHPEHRLTERKEQSREAQARRRRKRAVRRAAATAQQTADGTL